ncbi:protein FAM240C-like [Danio aesculapii]|uniref:protein FAM240C-like n=1 Tax=Danio aesculapii TaxID=1142201 RepID=UPI0024C02AB9|nr:protein FAM240C-like [Danio aesculapii]
MMNLARIHDKHQLKKFWEQKIESHSERMGNEDCRMKSSALSRLREEWLERLQVRNQHVTESMREEQIRKAQRIQGLLRV